MVTPTHIEVGPDGCTLRDSHLAVRRLPSVAGRVRVALVATQAMLLADDHVRIEVVVDGPVALEVVETAGTVAYDMRGRSARWEVDVRLDGDADLLWLAEPLVISAGASVARSLTVGMSGGSRATLRESVVFGRSGEVGGSLTTTTSVTSDDAPVLEEELELTSELRRGPATLGGRRCLDSLTTLGHRLPASAGVLQLQAEASVWRWTGDELHRSPVRRADAPSRRQAPAAR